MPYTPYAIDQQSCKDHNGLKLEEEVIKRVKELPILKESEKEIFAVFDYEKGTNGETLAVISIYLVMKGTKTPSDKRTLSGYVIKKVVADKVHQLSVEHRFLLYTPELLQTVARVSEVRNQYELVVNHLVASFNESIKSLIHYLKTGEQLQQTSLI